ncbi:MAG: lysylphosphatidylglycerol synthase transmembrane domain-containing protein [Gaiellaceae bacterium]
MSRGRAVRLAATLAVTGLGTAYIVWKIDLRRTAHVIGHARGSWLLASLAIMTLSVLPMAWRWQRLLAARGVHAPLRWLVRTYFVGYAAGQVLPTALGGDASRIFETARRHEGAAGAAAGTVLLERALGGAATLTLAAIGFALAVGRFDVGGYLWVELAFVVATALLGVLLFSTRVHRPLQRVRPVLRTLRVERLLREVYLALHSFRNDAGLLVSMFALTLAVQAVRVLAIWCTGKAVGVDLSPRPYFVMGPLLFLVALVPFTINALAVRESFFVSFLGGLGVGPDPAFATGFLYFAVTIALALPGAAVLGWEALRKP